MWLILPFGLQNKYLRFYSYKILDKTPWHKGASEFSLAIHIESFMYQRFWKHHLNGQRYYRGSFTVFYPWSLPCALISNPATVPIAWAASIPPQVSLTGLLHTCQTCSCLGNLLFLLSGTFPAERMFMTCLFLASQLKCHLREAILIHFSPTFPPILTSNHPFIYPCGSPFIL